MNVRQAKSSFLKKRTKKLLRFASGGRLNTTRSARLLKDKGFLVLFLKKEHLSL